MSSESNTGATPLESSVNLGAGLTYSRHLIQTSRRATRRAGANSLPPEPTDTCTSGTPSYLSRFRLAAEFGGKCNLRFDDTNPSKEETEYVDSIMEDVRWLGSNGMGCLRFRLFGQLYEWAVQLSRGESLCL